MSSSEKAAHKLLLDALILIEIVDPNNPLRDEIEKFLNTTTHTDLGRLVGWLITTRKDVLEETSPMVPYYRGYLNALALVRDRIAKEFGVGEANEQ